MDQAWGGATHRTGVGDGLRGPKEGAEKGQADKDGEDVIRWAGSGGGREKETEERRSEIWSTVTSIISCERDDSLNTH